MRTVFSAMISCVTVVHRDVSPLPTYVHIVLLTLFWFRFVVLRA